MLKKSKFKKNIIIFIKWNMYNIYVVWWITELSEKENPAAHNGDRINLLPPNGVFNRDGGVITLPDCLKIPFSSNLVGTNIVGLVSSGMIDGKS